MSGFRTIPFLLQFSILSLFPSTHAFSVSPRRGNTRIVSSTRRYNFFQNLINEAFSNDDSLSTDRKEGQLEGSGDDSGSQQRRQELTATQEKWRQMNSQVGNLEDRKFLMDFFLSGVPNKDPSNDLYGSKVNISSRDRQVGQALPIEPTVAGIEIAFLPEGVCRCLTSTAFTNSNEDGVPDGDWLVSEDGKQVRFRIDVTGYARTVETKGTIQAVAWSNEPDQVVSSSTTYSIPAGWLYGEATVSRDPKGNIRWENGILKVEQSTGLLGAGSKMTPCGKFQAQPVANYV